MIINYIEEAINLEHKMSRLYTKFAAIKDYDFWFKIALEELRHGSILQNMLYAIKISESDVSSDFDISEENLQELRLMNHKIEVLIEGEIEEDDIIKIALELESSASEAHYQKLSKKDSDNLIVKTFMKLGKDDVDHYNRILKYSKNSI